MLRHCWWHASAKLYRAAAICSRAVPTPKCGAGKADVLLVAALDELAWLLNLRGSDVAYTPVFIGYGIVTQDTATLYVDPSKVPASPQALPEYAARACQHQPAIVLHMLKVRHAASY